MLGSHLGDMSGFLFGKTIGPSLLSTKFISKREKTIKRAQRFLDKTGSYTVILGRFIPAIRAIVPFLLICESDFDFWFFGLGESV